MEKQNSIKAVLFDFDGTIAFLPTCYDRLQSRLRVFFSQFEVVSDFCPLIESIQHSLLELRKRGMPESFVEQVKGNALGIVQDEELKAVEVARLAQGAKEVLSVLKEGNIAIAIVSRNGIRCIQRCFSKFDLPNPDLIVAREATNELKPHPEHFRLALERLGVTPSEAVVIGDSHHDIDGGRKLGIETVLVAHGEDRMFERQAKPDLEIKRLSEILGLLF